MGIEEELQKEKLQNSRDFKEITLAITLLAGVSAFLLKTIDYFNNNVIVLGDFLQLTVYFLVMLLLLEFSMVFLFLILKGYLLSTESESKQIKNITHKLFKSIFILPILWIVFSIFTLLSHELFKEPSKINNYNYIFNFYWVFASMTIIWIYVHLAKIHLIRSLKNTGSKIKQIEIKSLLKNFDFKNQMILNLSPLIIFLIVGLLLLLVALLLTAPLYLLTGSFSIEEFSQSNTNTGIQTFKIKETGIVYSANYINLYKMNASDGNIFQYIDDITINNSQENLSRNKLMIGKKYEGIWYLNVNTSTLQSGNYLLHAEVTNGLSEKTVFGTIKKHDEKLFYIAPRIANYSSYSTQELKRIETTQ
ncbi:MAG: hypothetical protein O8C63_01675 [Candidatus Methanoperedens sp.]|nr:hypothetical protein [Candidatus Methanoperedens sp.]